MGWMTNAVEIRFPLTQWEIFYLKSGEIWSKKESVYFISQQRGDRV